MKALLKAVKKHSGMDDEDIREIRSAYDGYPGFSYYKDTCKFYDKYKHLIWDRLIEISEEIGETPLETISKFGVADTVEDDVDLKNLLAWFALEEAAEYLRVKEEE